MSATDNRGEISELVKLIEAAIFAAMEPIPSGQLEKLLPEVADPPTVLAHILDVLHEHYSHRGIELVQVASGWRFQVPKSVAVGLEPIYQEKPKRLSRVILETLAIIAYQQPITRAEIEAIRGVAVSTEALKSLLDRQWICSLGVKEVPGRPTQYGTTAEFLDHFNLRSIDELPVLNPGSADVPFEC